MVEGRSSLLLVCVIIVYVCGKFSCTKLNAWQRLQLFTARVTSLGLFSVHDMSSTGSR